MATTRSGDKMTGSGVWDLFWDYNPFTYWINFLRDSVGQFGLNNTVINMKTDDPDTELGVVTSVGSYGKQLGRVIEALQAVCESLGESGWTLTHEQREAVKDFIHLADDIDKYKRDHSPVRKGSLDDIRGSLDSINALMRDVCRRTINSERLP